MSYLPFARAVLAATCVLLPATGCTPEPETPATRDTITPVGREPIQPIPLAVKVDSGRVLLGKLLFHDVRLSGDQTVSCFSCHRLAEGGDDNRAVSLGVQGREGKFNSPTVFNSAWNFRQFWDGRVQTLEEQVDGPIHNVHEMNSNWPQILERLRAAPHYTRLFRENYADGIQIENIRDALAEYERSLITPNARFDQYLRGDSEAINAQEKEGYRLFKEYGCASCHQGTNVGGNMFQTFGVMKDYIPDDVNRGPGRFAVTRDASDLNVYKVPGLRNVAVTAPYFHDGRTETLEEAVHVMGAYQLGRDLNTREVAAIVAFLRTLTGEYKGQPL